MSLSKHKKIPTYDFPEEILSEVFKRLPVKYVLRCGAVQKSCQSIAYFIEVDEDDAKEEEDGSGSPHLDIWVLKDNMEREDDLFGELPWEKKMSVGLGENVWVEVLGIRNNGEPILAKSNNLISYDLDTHEPYDFVESCDRLTPRYDYEEGSKPPFIISPFVETLVLLDID